MMMRASSNKNQHGNRSGLSSRRKKKTKDRCVMTLFIHLVFMTVILWLLTFHKFRQHIHEEDGTNTKWKKKDSLSTFLNGQKAQVVGYEEISMGVSPGTTERQESNHDHSDFDDDGGGDGDNFDDEFDGGDDHNDDRDETAFLTMYGRHRFDDSFRSLPKWLQEYFNWHRLQTTTNRTNTEYLVLTCLPKDDCGGLSDRFRPLPFYLFIAKHTHRVFCIHWVKNFGLEEYLQPIPDIGIEWRCPAELGDGMYDLNSESMNQPNILMWKFVWCHNMKKPMAPCFEDDMKIAKARYRGKYATVGLFSRGAPRINRGNLLVQRHSYGGTMAEDGAYYMPDIYNWQHAEMIGDIFRVMFEPVPALAKRINATMANLGLVENKFISAHLRIRYPTGRLRKIFGKKATFDIDGGLDYEKVKSYTADVVHNALECGHMLAPDLNKILFISDHHEATRYAITNDFIFGKGGKDEATLRPVGIDRDQEPLHMEGNHTRSNNALDFFPVFEDLLIMGGSRCVSHGIGSFGSFGAALSSGNKCRIIHQRYNGDALRCPNDISLQNPVVINATEMVFGEEPGGEGKLTYDINRYVQLPMTLSDNEKIEDK